MSASPPTRSPAEPAGGCPSLAWFFGYGSLMWRPGFLHEACEVLGIRPGVIGLVFAVSSIGYLVGALAANRLSRRFGVGPTIIIGAATIIITQMPSRAMSRTCKPSTV